MDNTARIWDSASGRPLATFKGYEDDVSRAVFSSDGSKVFTVSSSEIKFWEKTKWLWDSATGKQLSILKEDIGTSDTAILFENAIFSPDGAKVLVKYMDSTARIWRVPPASLLVEK